MHCSDNQESQEEEQWRVPWSTDVLQHPTAQCFLLLSSAWEECWRREFHVTQTNSCQKSQMSPPWGRERRATGRRWRRTMREEIALLLQKNCHRVTRYGFLTRGKKERLSRIMRPQDPSSSRPLMVACWTETDRWPGSCMSQRFLLIQWRTPLQAWCQQMHLPTLMQTDLQTTACLSQQLCLPFQSHNIQWKLPSLCRPNNNLNSEDPVELKRRLGVWLKNFWTVQWTQKNNVLTWVDRRRTSTKQTVKK